jgi:spoIIIJ-associated protein
MPKILEFESSSVEKAVKKACEELNLDEKELEHDIISYGSTGIFGLVGTKKARIRVVVPEEDGAVKKESMPEIGESVTSDEITTTVPATEATSDAPTEVSHEQDPPRADAYPEEEIELGRQALQRMVDFITTGASITVNNSPDQIEYNVTGGNTGVLIGKRGQTLEAMQYLIDKIVNKKSDQRIRLQVDVAGYLENRRLSLKKMAQRMGEKAKKTGKPISVGQMNAHDRRIIHIALKEDDTVWTQSVGDGFYRKLLIFPKKRNGRKQNAS